ncbi:hypothetical protein S7711_07730 [Stachybotrys chartarum IBT 7711]|uniref:Heterokaryon incompatibility domain-containing protein n=1 Tax=Stachybotrys chartarum (strain CBS 109288 / IBT 7711) TaxID=1280523 RepID=A0A084B805_STACB|nr:hypothetical protein S7711_07730 [Stachybotrys chartarum IBT 7711]
MIDINYTPLVVWYASFLNIPHPGKDHSTCTEFKCLAYQIDEANYQTAHCTANCNCEFVYASQNTLSSILLGPTQAIPLVQPTDPQRGQGIDNRLYADLVSSKTSAAGSVANYVAISHVWSDGLGNNKENAIPLCQFNRIRKLVSDLYGGRPVALWLDTLCFPLKPQEAYNKALVRMKESYEASDKVLVLDGYLLETAIGQPDQSLDEFMVRIAMCPWNRRLWTYQEARLAKPGQLHFQFQDEATSDDRLLNQSNRVSSLDNLIAQAIYARFEDIRSRNGSSSITEALVRMKDALTFRATSQGPDEVLCLSNLLGVGSDTIVNTEPKKRMEIFWKTVVQDPKDYHVSMIFWEGPKLDVKGYTWAPASFMDACKTSAQLSFLHLNGRVLGLSKHGLRIRLPAFVFSKIAGMDNSRLHYLKVYGDDQNSIVQLYALKLPESLIPGGASQRSRLFSKSLKFAILLSMPFEHVLSNKASMLDVQVAAVSILKSTRLHLRTTATLARLDAVFEQGSVQVMRRAGQIGHFEGSSDVIADRALSVSLVPDGEWEVA